MSGQPPSGTGTAALALSARVPACSDGPRIARRWIGAGGHGWSTGAGPVSAYRPDRRRRKRR